MYITAAQCNNFFRNLSARLRLVLLELPLDVQCVPAQQLAAYDLLSVHTPGLDYLTSGPKDKDI